MTKSKDESMLKFFFKFTSNETYENYVLTNKIPSDSSLICFQTPVSTLQIIYPDNCVIM